MTLLQRVAAFQQAFCKWPASWPWLVQEGGHDAMYGVWVIGNDYRNKTTYYGAYPHGYLDRVMALFPEFQPNAPGFDPTQVLHLFSGSLPVGPYERCDMAQESELNVSVYNLPNIILNWQPRLIIADPPYSKADAKKYGTPMIDRRRVMATLARITKPGAFVVWLDTTWPMHRRNEWHTVGRILLRRSTMHRSREVSIFERQ